MIQWAFLMVNGKEFAYQCSRRVQPLGWEEPLEKEMATHSSILVWRAPWTEEPGRLSHWVSNGSQMVRLTVTEQQ